MKSSIALTPALMHVVPLLMVLAAAAGCQQSRELNGVSETKFVTVMAALQQVRDKPGLDSSKRAFSRDSILQRQGLTPAQLAGAAKQLAQNPARAQTVWQAIERRANARSTVAKPDTSKGK